MSRVSVFSSSFSLLFQPCLLSLFLSFSSLLSLQFLFSLTSLALFCLFFCRTSLSPFSVFHSVGLLRVTFLSSSQKDREPQAITYLRTGLTSSVVVMGHITESGACETYMPSSSSISSS